MTDAEWLKIAQELIYDLNRQHKDHAAWLAKRLRFYFEPTSAKSDSSDTRPLFTQQQSFLDSLEAWYRKGKP